MSTVDEEKMDSRQPEPQGISSNDEEKTSNARSENILTDFEYNPGDDMESTNHRETKKESLTAGRFKAKSSGVRLLMRHLGKQKRKVHPENSIMSPQLVVKNGRFEIFEPEKLMQRQLTTLSRHIREKKERETTFCSCFKLLKWKMDMLRFKYGDMVPFFRKQIKKVEGNYGTGVASVFIFTRWAIIFNIFLSIIWVGFLVIPAAIKFNYSSLDQFQFKVENLFDGKGKLQYTWLFYGNYSSNINGYRLDFAYIMLGLLTFFGSLLVILKGTVDANVAPDNFPFTMLQLTTWDFSITAKETRKALAAEITSYAKDLLSEARALLKTRSRSRKKNYLVYFGRLFAWIVTCGLIGGACATIYYFMTTVTVAEFIVTNTNVQIGKTFLEVYGFSILFSLLNAVLPFIIEKLPLMEAYEKGSHILYVNVIRVFLLRFLNIIALMFTLYNTVTSSKFRGCGGTFIGQEFYKIILLDTAVVTVLQLVTKFGWYAIRRKKNEPSVSKIVLQIVYRQALIWAGTFFCPVMPTLGIITQAAVFLVNYVIVIITCKAPTKRFRQTEGTVFFKGCLIVTLVCLLVPISTVFASRHISIGTLTTTSNNGTILKYSCGPFGDKPPMEVFKEARAKLPGWLLKVADWITSTAVFPAILVLSIIIYIQHLRIANQKKKFKELERDHLEFQKRSNLRLLTTNADV